MTLFNSDPYIIDDIDTLREMVNLLQKANNNLTQIQTIQRDLQDTLYAANVQQGERIEKLYERIDILLERIDILQRGVTNNDPKHTLRLN